MQLITQYTLSALGYATHVSQKYTFVHLISAKDAGGLREVSEWGYDVVFKRRVWKKVIAIYLSTGLASCFIDKN